MQIGAQVSPICRHIIRVVIVLLSCASWPVIWQRVLLMRKVICCISSAAVYSHVRSVRWMMPCCRQHLCWCCLIFLCGHAGLSRQRLPGFRSYNQGVSRYTHCICSNMLCICCVGHEGVDIWKFVFLYLRSSVL